MSQNTCCTSKLFTVFSDYLWHDRVVANPQAKMSWHTFCEHITWAHTHLTLTVSPVTSRNMLSTLAHGGKCSTSSMSPFCLSHLRAREKLWGREQGSISGHHLKLGSQTFYDCWAKWIWDRGNSPYLSSRQPHFLAPCSPCLVRWFLFLKDKQGLPHCWAWID